MAHQINMHFLYTTVCEVADDICYKGSTGDNLFVTNYH